MGPILEEGLHEKNFLQIPVLLSITILKIEEPVYYSQKKDIGQVSDEIKLRGTRIEGLAERVKSIEDKEGSMDDRIKKNRTKKIDGPLI